MAENLPDRRYRLFIGERVAYDDYDPIEATQLLLKASETFADRIQLLVGEPIEIEFVSMAVNKSS